MTDTSHPGNNLPPSRSAPNQWIFTTITYEEYHAAPEGAAAIDEPSGTSDGGFGASFAVNSLELYRAEQPGTDFESQEKHEVLDVMGGTSLLGNTACDSVDSRPTQDASPPFHSSAPQDKPQNANGTPRR